MPEMDEREVRSDSKGMLVCKVIPTENGDYNLVTKNGRKEDMTSVSSFLNQVYRKPVIIIVP